MSMATKSKALAPMPIKPFTLAYASAKLGVSLPTVYRLIRDGKLRTYKIGAKGRRISDQAIADCIALLEAEDNKIAPRPCADAAIIRRRRQPKATMKKEKEPPLSPALIRFIHLLAAAAVRQSMRKAQQIPEKQAAPKRRKRGKQ